MRSVRKQHIQRGVCIVLAAAMAAGGAFPAFAQRSPDFARTEEEWARLRDDNLEFDEIPDLIYEYNSTVLQNSIDYYQNYRGKTSTEIAESYYEAAEQIAERLEFPDADSSNYASAVSQYLNSQISYERLMEQGDSNTNDGDIVLLQNMRTEANLAKQAQDQMISYWSQLGQLDTLRANVSQAEEDLNAVDLRISAGTATAASRASAEESLLSAQASLTSAESSLASLKENLCLSMGWAYGAPVNICALPEPDEAAMNAIDLAGDIERAKENNYSLKITKRQLDNARTGSVTETLTETKRMSEESIASNVSSLYQALQLARSSYAQALEALTIQQTAMNTADRKKSAGTITQNSWNQIRTGLVRAQVTANTRKLDVLKAFVDYNWAVSGLASV